MPMIGCGRLRRVARILFLFVALGAGAALAQEAPAPQADPGEPAPAVPAPETEADAESTTVAEQATDTTDSLQDGLNTFFGTIVSYMFPVLFYPVFDLPHPASTEEAPLDPVALPLIVVVLAGGGLFFTFRYGFVNVRLFGHALAVVRGHYDDPNDKGEVSHFKALTSALAATVGLGNIAGVALAITAGGPGAVFWMWLTAFFGMSMKFSSCTLAQLYRRFNEDGHVLGGPMVYLSEGIKQRVPALGFVGMIFGPLFAVLTVFAAFGGGNMFQANQTNAAIQAALGMDNSAFGLGVGVLLAAAVGVVIIGGIRRIGDVTAALVPTMCLGYCVICLYIVVVNIGEVPALFGAIFAQAFAPEALYGGFLGVLVQGMRRAAFSNEAGLGSAAIAHAAARTHEPVREGLVAMLGPFIDTIIVCTVTALAILITGAHVGADGLEGIATTSRAFEAAHPIFQLFLTVAVVVFAYSTLLSWSYYGERAIEYLFGKRGIGPYRTAYVIVAMFAPILSLGAVVDFADMMLLSMAFPNILGMLLLSGQVKELVDDYVRRLKSGEMKPLK